MVSYYKTMLQGGTSLSVSSNNTATLPIGLQNLCMLLKHSDIYGMGLSKVEMKPLFTLNLNIDICVSTKNNSNNNNNTNICRLLSIYHVAQCSNYIISLRNSLFVAET